MNILKAKRIAKKEYGLELWWDWSTKVWFLSPDAASGIESDNWSGGTMKAMNEEQFRASAAWIKERVDKEAE